MAAAGAPIRVPVAVACRVLGLSTQGYYRWLRSPVSQRDWDDAHVIDQLREIRRLTQELGVNLAGVEEIIRLRDRLDQLQSNMENRITHLQTRLGDHLDELRLRALPSAYATDDDEEDGADD